MEIEHVTPYLPYNVQCTGQYDTTGKTIRTLEGDDIPEVLTRHNDKYKRKLILRPMVDFLKKIKHSGDRFDPNEKMWALYMDRHWNSLMDETDNEMIYTRKVRALISSAIKSGSHRFLDKLPHWAFRQLLEWHFDVFGLIESGKAISIHDIKQRA